MSQSLKSARQTLDLLVNDPTTRKLADFLIRHRNVIYSEAQLSLMFKLTQKDVKDRLGGCGIFRRFMKMRSNKKWAFCRWMFEYRESKPKQKQPFQLRLAS